MLGETQKTLLKPIKIQGVGLHSGLKANVVLKPSLPNTGITFKRVDQDGKKNVIKASYKNVSSAKLCTKIENSFGVSVSTIEHLMAAFYGEGIDNALVEVDNSEIPIMDGSANVFVQSIRTAGIEKQNVSRKFIEVLKKIEIVEGSKLISIEPAKKDFKIDFKLVYENELIGTQREILNVSKDNLETIYNSRTFCLYEDIEKIRSCGMGKGGSLDNAIVVQGNKILNDHGLRYKNEFVKHKILDCMGDFMLSGHRVFGFIKCIHGGHQLTVELLNKFFADSSNWKLVSSDKEYLESPKYYNYNRPIVVNA